MPTVLAGLWSVLGRAQWLTNEHCLMSDCNCAEGQPISQPWLFALESQCIVQCTCNRLMTCLVLSWVMGTNFSYVMRAEEGEAAINWNKNSIAVNHNLVLLEPISSCGLFSSLNKNSFQFESILHWPFLANIVVFFATKEQKCNNCKLSPLTWFEVARSRYRLDSSKGLSPNDIHKFCRTGKSPLPSVSAT